MAIDVGSKVIVNDKDNWYYGKEGVVTKITSIFGDVWTFMVEVGNVSFVIGESKLIEVE